MGLLDITLQSTLLTSVEQLVDIGFKLYHQYEIVTDPMEPPQQIKIMRYDKTFHYENPSSEFFEKTRLWVNYIAMNINGCIYVDIEIINFDRLLFQKKWVNEYLTISKKLRFQVSEMETVQMILSQDWFTSLLKEGIEEGYIIFPLNQAFF